MPDDSKSPDVLVKPLLPGVLFETTTVEELTEGVLDGLRLREATELETDAEGVGVGVDEEEDGSSIMERKKSAFRGKFDDVALVVVVVALPPVKGRCKGPDAADDDAAAASDDDANGDEDNDEDEADTGPVPVFDGEDESGEDVLG
jgi:hypothetical protein